MVNSPEEEEIIAEYGVETPGEKIKVSQETPMEEGTVYQFFYEVHSLPIPLPGIKTLRATVLTAFLALQEKFRGLKVIFYKFTDKSLVFEAVGKSSSPQWKKIALSVLIVAATGLFLAAGIIILIAWVKKIIPKPLLSWMPPWYIWLLIFVGGSFLVGYVKGRGKQVIVKLEKKEA